MIFTDTHTHLYYETDTESRKLLMDRCFENDVKRLFLPNVDSESPEMVAGLTNEYPDHCFPMTGLHPCNVKENYLEELEYLQNNRLSAVVAIGEIGIDLYWE